VYLAPPKKTEKQKQAAVVLLKKKISFMTSPDATATVQEGASRDVTPLPGNPAAISLLTRK
jgi:hypothetical protein